MANVKVIKLMTGLEIIAKVVSETASEIVVDAPLTIQVMRNGNAPEMISIGLAPFSWAGVATDVSMNKSHILCTMNAESQLETQYLAALAGIAVPQPQTTERPRLTLVE